MGGMKDLFGDTPYFVDVTPLEPPFHGKIRTLHFTDFDKLLVITESEYQHVIAMFGVSDLTERNVRLSAAPDGKCIRIEPIAS